MEFTLSDVDRPDLHLHPSPPPPGPVLFHLTEVPVGVIFNCCFAAIFTSLFCFLLIHAFFLHSCDWWLFCFSTSGYVVGTVPHAEIILPFWLTPSGVFQCVSLSRPPVSHFRGCFQHECLWANPPLHLKATFGLWSQLAKGKGQLLCSARSLPCALQMVLGGSYVHCFPHCPAYTICFYFCS